MHPRFVLVPSLVILAACLAPATASANPTVTNVRSAQIAGTHKVEITYDLEDGGDPVVQWSVSVQVSSDGGQNYNDNVPDSAFSGDGFGNNVTRGYGRKIIFDATNTPLASVYSRNIRFKVVATGGDGGGESLQHEKVILIPQGTFKMGEYQEDVYVDNFYIAQYPVTKYLWDKVASWAQDNEYDIGPSTAGGKAHDHPAHSVNWFSAVKWCNAYTEFINARDSKNLTPVYTRSSDGTIFKTGQEFPLSNSAATGFRLPTQAEWEKAARGGLVGKLFPTGDIISHDVANYFSWWIAGSPVFGYDEGNESGLHPEFAVGDQPYTSPVNRFPPNGYNLYDMAGNVMEYTSDFLSGHNVFVRGGSWARHPYVSIVYWPVTRGVTQATDWSSDGMELGFRPARRAFP
jgi:formylglycine-generating enzyme